ncbi:MAG: hypothetical protein ACREM3_26915 [Candidatus Rokuibacteriota bacterium]
MIAFLVSKPASDVTVAQSTKGGEWKRESAAAPDVDRTWDGREKEGEKSDDEAHDRDT